jgi:hypothetical protein
LILDENEVPKELFDMLQDPLETHNLLESFPAEVLKKLAATAVGSAFNLFSDDGALSPRNRSLLLREVLGPVKRKTFSIDSDVTRELLFNDRNSSSLHLALTTSLFKLLFDFAKSGNEAHQLYLRQNPGRHYLPTPLSDNRPYRPNHVLKKYAPAQLQQLRNQFLREGQCSSACRCELPVEVESIATLPFHEVPLRRRYLTPKTFVNGTLLLLGS